ncbi:unnamed protein product, partial [Prorocentrum cordatum]
MTEPQNWLVELDGEGGVPRLPGDEEGVLRTGWGDTVQFVLPAGSLPLLKGQPELVVLDELGTQACINNMPPTGPIGDWKAQWHPAKPGPYELFVRAAGFEGPRCRIVVDPLMTLNGKPLPARSVVQLTVLSRCAGAIERWPEALAPQGALGYNMVHFTPIQPPGEPRLVGSSPPRPAVLCLQIWALVTVGFLFIFLFGGCSLAPGRS